MEDPSTISPLNELQRKIRTQCTEDPSGNKRRATTSSTLRSPGVGGWVIERKLVT